MHKDLAERALKAHPEKQIFPIENYLNDDALKDLLVEIKNSRQQ